MKESKKELWESDYNFHNFFGFSPVRKLLRHHRSTVYSLTGIKWAALLFIRVN